MAIWDHPCEQSDTTENITFQQLQRYLETRALREEYHYTCHLLNGIQGRCHNNKVIQFLRSFSSKWLTSFLSFWYDVR